jgi:hypothetical protein
MPIEANLSVNNYFNAARATVTIAPANYSIDAVATMSVVEKSAGHEALETALRQIAEAARSIRYGSIEVVIHEGRIVQIERKEKIRIAKDSC